MVIGHASGLIQPSCPSTAHLINKTEAAFFLPSLCFDMSGHILYILYSGLLFIAASLIHRVIKDPYPLFSFSARGTPAFQIAEKLKNVLEGVRAPFYRQNNKSFGESERASVSELGKRQRRCRGKICSRSDFYSTRQNSLNRTEKDNLLYYAPLTGLYRKGIKEPIRS